MSLPGEFGIKDVQKDAQEFREQHMVTIPEPQMFHREEVSIL